MFLLAWLTWASAQTSVNLTEHLAAQQAEVEEAVAQATEGPAVLAAPPLQEAPPAYLGDLPEGLRHAWQQAHHVRAALPVEDLLAWQPCRPYALDAPRFAFLAALEAGDHPLAAAHALDAVGAIGGPPWVRTYLAWQGHDLETLLVGRVLDGSGPALEALRALESVEATEAALSLAPVRYDGIHHPWLGELGGFYLHASDDQRRRILEYLDAAVRRRAAKEALSSAVTSLARIREEETRPILERAVRLGKPPVADRARAALAALALPP